MQGMQGLATPWERNNCFCAVGYRFQRMCWDGSDVLQIFHHLSFHW
jgi:hypothetical protein